MIRSREASDVLANRTHNELERWVNKLVNPHSPSLRCAMRRCPTRYFPYRQCRSFRLSVTSCEGGHNLCMCVLLSNFFTFSVTRWKGGGVNGAAAQAAEASPHPPPQPDFSVSGRGAGIAALRTSVYTGVTAHVKCLVHIRPGDHQMDKG